MRFAEWKESTANELFAKYVVHFYICSSPNLYAHYIDSVNNAINQSINQSINFNVTCQGSQSMWAYET